MPVNPATDPDHPVVAGGADPYVYAPQRGDPYDVPERDARNADNVSPLAAEGLSNHPIPDQRFDDGGGNLVVN